MKRTLKFYFVYFFFYFPLSLRMGPLTSPLHLSLSFATLVASVHDETRGPNFPFWWSSSRFLLDSLFFFYHLVSMRWLLLLLLKFQIIWFLYLIFNKVLLLIVTKYEKVIDMRKEFIWKMDCWIFYFTLCYLLASKTFRFVLPISKIMLHVNWDTFHICSFSWMPFSTYSWQ